LKHWKKGASPRYSETDGGNNRLIGAARKAGEQLELWKPVALIPNPKTFLHASAIVPADPGTVLIVLAHARQVLTMRLLQPPPDFSRRKVIDDLVDMARRHYAQDDEKNFDKGEIIPVMDAVVDKWGGQPGTETGFVPDIAAMNLIGLLFAAISPDKRGSLLDLLEAMIDRGLCPAMVGLLSARAQSMDCAAFGP
jgi:hypothetical protein